MVTANVEDVASEFQDIVEERDVVGLSALVTAGALGGALAQQLSRFTFDTLGRSPRPSSTTGLAASGALKAAIGALHIFIGDRIGGAVGLTLTILGIGALVVGGGDFVNLGLGLAGSGTGQMSTPTGNRAAQQAWEDAGPAGSSDSTTTTAQSTEQTGGRRAQRRAR